MNRMRNALVRVLAGIGLVLTGLPHAFCDCGCGEPAKPVEVALCPHCDKTPDDAAPDRSKPCQCRQCELVDALPPGPLATAPSLDVTSHIDTPAVAAVLPLASASAREKTGRANPVDVLPRYGCALTILLGHLLL